jgi:hypothetical protein
MLNPSDPEHEYRGPERRRYPRVTPGDEMRLTIPVVVDAEVLDISSGGALISTENPIQIGERGHLRVLLDREPFNAWVLVRRVDAGTVRGAEVRFHAGVSFSAIDSTSRRSLQKFVRDDSRA